ncbi:unnamed protein product [Nezara viridula]|uniref:Uncharacterized protein n=1 Tax=Nezara viridula TaxID=85310 RepID=A0A9P0HS80_NEZVI|nr:unnamed protein product [Nezara viridula]
MALQSYKNPNLLHYSQPISTVLCYLPPSSSNQPPQIVLNILQPSDTSTSFAIRLLMQHPLWHSCHMI